MERLIFASRNIMNALKNFKGIRHNMDEFDSQEQINNFDKAMDMKEIIDAEKTKSQANPELRYSQ